MIITLIGGKRHGQKHDVAPDINSLEFEAGTLENPMAVERYRRREWIDVGQKHQQVTAKLYFVVDGLSDTETARKVIEVVTGRV